MKNLKKGSPENRLLRLLHFDAEVQVRHPQNTLLGCDEVGRGSLIANVVACVVAWKHAVTSPNSELIRAFHGLNDSKQCSATLRKSLVPVIETYCHIGMGEATPYEICELNIIKASHLAMQRAYEALPLKVENPLLMVDGREALDFFPKQAQYTVIKGDAQSALIAMASIVAKEHRDEWIKNLVENNQEYLIYGWHRNMGYATKEHREAMNEHGLTPWHRPTFCKGFL